MKENKESKWVEIARRGDNHPLLLIDTVAEGYRKGYLGMKENEPEVKIKYYRQLSGARWFWEEDLKKYIENFKDREVSEPGILVKYADEYIRRINRVRSFADKYREESWGDKTQQELTDIFADFIDLTQRMWAFAYNYIIVNKFLPDIIFAEITKLEKDVDKQNEYFIILLQLEDSSEARKEKISLLRIAEKVDSQGFNGQAMNLIKQHLDKYEYLGQYYYRGRGYTAEVIKRRIKEVLNSGLNKEWERINRIENDLRRSKKLKQTLGLDAAILKHTESARAQAAVSNYVDESYTYAVYYLKPLFNEIAERLGLSYRQLIELRGQEIIDSLKKRELVISKAEIEEREKENSIILEGGKIRVLSGQELKNYRDTELAEEEDYGQIEELKGQGASPGSGTGIVKLAMRDADAEKVKKGDILVAPATNPTLVPAMEKAAAIITDEGGLLSHAAIVSRELGVTCLVGTKIATKVLQDGDEVEVDADKGVVRKMN